MAEPISPRGTARLLFEGEPTEDEIDRLFSALRRAAIQHDVSDSELYLAEELVRMSSWLAVSQVRALSFAVIATLVSTRQGSTRLPLSGGPRGVLGSLLASLAAAARIDVPIKTLLRDVRKLATDNYFGRIIGRPDEDLPFVTADDCLYEQRLYRAEERLVRRAAERLDGPGRDPAAIADAAARAATAGPFELTNEQRRAVELALARPMSLITGGPGTGKTAIAAAIVRAASTLGAREIAVAAPTGKAAQRLGESLQRGLRASGSAAGDVPVLPEPRTLHRLLGYRPGGGFRHHENHPMPADLVLVDEASMIDLTLMERLLAALSPGAQLVLLGDAEQLPSVDSGSVLRDLALAGDRLLDRPPYSARLSESFRMDPRDPDGRAIFELSRSIAAGDARAAAAIPARAPTFRGIERAPKTSAAELEALITRWIEEHFLDPELDRLARRWYPEQLDEADGSELRTLLASCERAKILTTTRRLALGSTSLGQRVHALYRRALGRPELELGPGEPVMVTRNDYRRELFNGDVGVLVRVEAEGGSLRVAFDKRGEIVLYPLDALRGIIEPGHAITVHRSQGSEYQHVMLVLPERDLPILTRELLYTAVTRARSSVTVFGSPALMKAGTRRTVQRFSGIVEKLARPAEPPITGDT